MNKINVDHPAHPAYGQTSINTITTDVNAPVVPAVADPVAVAEQAFANRLRLDAQALRNLRDALGYIQNGSSQPVTICQDDATGEWGVTCGHERYGIQRHFSGRTLEEALAKAGRHYKD